jgi:hypothetical protein
MCTKWDRWFCSESLQQSFMKNGFFRLARLCHMHAMFCLTVLDQLGRTTNMDSSLSKAGASSRCGWAAEKSLLSLTELANGGGACKQQKWL